LARAAAVAALLGTALPAFSAAAPSGADLARCAGVAAPDARLACYDALAGRPADRTPPAASVTGAASSTSAPSTAGPAGTTTAAPTAAASDAKNFGLPPAPVQKPAQNTAAVSAHIVKIIDNRVGHGYAVLDNGQTWVFVDPPDDSGLSPGDPITIKKGSLGSFVIVTASRRSYHVRRTQ